MTGAVMTPVFLTSTYAQKAPGEHTGFEYSRTQNPTRFALEANLAALEGGAWGLAFNAGVAASTAVLSHARRGRPRGRGRRSLRRLVPPVREGVPAPGRAVQLRRRARPGGRRRGASSRARSCAGWRRRPTRCCAWPTSAAIAAVCAARGVRLCVDNTFMTPYFQRPLDLGADLVVHSTTKYLNGHSDVVGGAVIGRDPELRARLAFLQNAMGGSQPAFDSFLVLRGTKTLAVRMERHAGQRAGGRALARGAAARSPGALPGPAVASAARAGAPPDVGLRRHGQLRVSRRDAAARRARAASSRRCGCSPAPSRWAASNRWPSTPRS